MPKRPTASAVQLTADPQYGSLLVSTRQEHKARLASFKNQLNQRISEKRGIQTNLDRLNLTLPLMRERVAAIKKLSEQGHFPRLRYLELQQEFITDQKELVLQRHKLSESGSAIAAIGEQIAQAKAVLCSSSTGTTQRENAVRP